MPNDAKRNDSRDSETTPGSGNVFADLNVSNPAESLLKAQLSLHIARLIEDKGWTQRQAATVMEIDQPKVSAMLRGRLGEFSIDRLIRFLDKLGQDIRIVVIPKMGEPITEKKLPAPRRRKTSRNDPERVKKSKTRKVQSL